MSLDPTHPGPGPDPGPLGTHDPAYERPPGTHDPAYERPPGTTQFDNSQFDRRRPPRGGPEVGIVTPHGRPGVYIYPFWQRSEFWAFLLTALAVGIAAAAADSFDAKGAWQLIAGLAAAYILSRGFAKREPRDDDDDRPWTPGSDAGNGDYAPPPGRFTR